MKSSKLAIVLLFFITLPLIACTKEEEEIEERQYAEIGEPVFHDSVLGDLEITLKSVSTVDEYEGEDPIRDHFVIVEMTFENVSDGPVRFVGQTYRVVLDTQTAKFYDKYYPDEFLYPDDQITLTFGYDINEYDEYRLDYNFGIFERLNITWYLSAGDFE